MEASQSSSQVELRGVSKIYIDGDVHALKSVSLEIPGGEFLSIMGPSGCGKSTMLNMLGALDRPTSGEVLFDGVSLKAVRQLDQLRSQRIGFVFQSFYLLPNLTAVENVQLPLFESKLSGAERAARAQDLLVQVGLGDRVGHLPRQLSIGQRQRVAIARALANSPGIILADEPTGSLDSQSGAEVMDLLSQLNAQHGTTLVVVTHDRQIADRAQRRIQMHDGEIVSDACV